MKLKNWDLPFIKLNLRQKLIIREKRRIQTISLISMIRLALRQSARAKIICMKKLMLACGIDSWKSLVLSQRSSRKYKQYKGWFARKRHNKGGSTHRSRKRSSRSNHEIEHALSCSSPERLLEFRRGATSELLGFLFCVQSKLKSNG